MLKPVSVAIYARISSDPSGEGLGVLRQLEDCRRLVAERGWVVGGEYVDNDVSAYSGRDRPEYQRMLGDLRDGRRDAVVVYNLDRLTRIPAELEAFVSLCETAGVRDIATPTGDMDFGTDDGLFTARIFAAFAAKESGRRSARLKRKARQRAEQGLPGGGPNRPFGYEQDKVTINAVEASAFRSLVERCLAGESARSLAVWMNDNGMPTIRGGDWKSTTVKGMLVNPRYAGLRALRGEVVGAAVWEPIISVDVHEQVLRMFEARKQSGRRAPRSYLLSGMLRCGKCGTRLYSSARGDRRRYVCMSGPDHGGCGKLTIVAGPLEEFIAEAVIYRLDHAAFENVLTGVRAIEEQQHELIGQLRSDRTRMDELATLWADGEISKAEWKTARERIEKRVQDTERQLAGATGTPALVELIGTGSALRAQWATLNLERQAAIVKAILDYATVMPSSVNYFDPNRVEPVWIL